MQQNTDYLNLVTDALIYIARTTSLRGSSGIPDDMKIITRFDPENKIYPTRLLTPLEILYCMEHEGGLMVYKKDDIEFDKSDSIIYALGTYSLMFVDSDNPDKIIGIMNREESKEYEKKAAYGARPSTKKHLSAIKFIEFVNKCIEEKYLFMPVIRINKKADKKRILEIFD